MVVIRQGRCILHLIYTVIHSYSYILSKPIASTLAIRPCDLRDSQLHLEAVRKAKYDSEAQKCLAANDQEQFTKRMVTRSWAGDRMLGSLVNYKGPGKPYCIHCHTYILNTYILYFQTPTRTLPNFCQVEETTCIFHSSHQEFATKQSTMAQVNNSLYIIILYTLYLNNYI